MVSIKIKNAKWKLFYNSPLTLLHCLMPRALPIEGVPCGFSHEIPNSPFSSLLILYFFLPTCSHVPSLQKKSICNSKIGTRCGTSVPGTGNSNVQDSISCCIQLLIKLEVRKKKICIDGSTIQYYSGLFWFSNSHLWITIII